MRANQSSAMPAPPNLIASLLGGFDAVAGRITLILFPLALDLLIWLGPHLGLKQLIGRFSDSLLAMSAAANPQSTEAMKLAQEVWAVVGERLNLAVALRTYPVGIPSLMAGRFPVEKPELVHPFWIEVTSWSGAAGIWLLLSVTGLFAASLYCMAVAYSAAPPGRRIPLRDWPWVTGQVFFLTLLWIALVACLSIPAFCVFSVLVLTNPALSNLAGLLFMGGLIWLLFPIFLSPHGIFVNRHNALVSLKKSFRLTRMTLPTTGLFFLMIIFLSQGLNILWKVPSETSWFTLVGLFGHSFIATGLLAASFIYYREADQFTQKMMSYWSQARL